MQDGCRVCSRRREIAEKKGGVRCHIRMSSQTHGTAGVSSFCCKGARNAEAFKALVRIAS